MVGRTALAPAWEKQLPMRIEHLPDLEIGDDSFAYKGRSYPYTWVQSITFHAVHTKHYTNFARTGDSYGSKLIYIRLWHWIKYFPAMGIFRIQSKA